MNNHRRCFVSLCTILALAMTWIFATPMLAQTTDFKIMVNGSWDYVIDPHPDRDPNPNADKSRRIVLVVPQAANHEVHYFGSDDATQFKGTPELPGPGLYYLDFDSSLRTFGGTPSQFDYPPMTYAAPQTVAPGLIDTVLFTPAPRFAISLPVPDYYTTYVGPYGLGLAESKVDIRHIAPSTPAREFTIWMVLHYQITKPNPSLTLGGKPDTGAQINQSVSSGKNAISLVTAATRNYSRCDTASGDSFAHAKALWHLTNFARFPEEDGSGNQNRGIYHYDCLEADLTASDVQKDFDKAQNTYKETLCIIGYLKKQLRQQLLTSQPKQRDNAKPAKDRNLVDCSSRVPETDAMQILATVRKAVHDLSFGGNPPNITQELDCVEALVNPALVDPKKKAEAIFDKCRGDVVVNADLIDNVLLKETTTMIAAAVGGTDCHAAQTSINGAVQ